MTKNQSDSCNFLYLMIIYYQSYDFEYNQQKKKLVSHKESKITANHTESVRTKNDLRFFFWRVTFLFNWMRKLFHSRWINKVKKIDLVSDLSVSFSSFFIRTPENPYKSRLRRSKIFRSPGGTPLVKNNFNEISVGEGLTPLLCNALKKKFHVRNHENVNFFPD